ncbi:hypothetical protein NEOLEDRAFT_1240400 [Neolentinus lepideus HHB14362 ss-1]|uniref:Uncharacterized protein n=1 Tax=Neolentinus lepideus HHB14362 ss-1 TaxID=1314782 RepID=A0A165U0X8_9AGAM|nr:hypothetical protein NEOLEDRAFT_1240400 [Neolentinus lepideus HHB14362 ss-1]
MTQDINVLDRVLALQREMVSLCHEAGDECRGMLLYSLATTLKRRHIRLRKQEDLDESIRLHEEVLEMRLSPHPERWRFLHGLAQALERRYRIAQDINVLEQMLVLRRELVSLHHQPGANKFKDMLLYGLVSDLDQRYARLGKEEDLDEAIKLHEVLDMRLPPHPDRWRSLTELGCALGQRYMKSHSPVVLDRMLVLQREAVSLRYEPGANSCQDVLLFNLASTLHRRYVHLGKEEDLDESLELHEQALSLRALDHPGRWRSLREPRDVLQKRYVKSQDPEVLRRMSDLQCEEKELLRCPSVSQPSS